MPANPGPAPSSMPCFPLTAAREKSPLRECCTCCQCTVLWQHAHIAPATKHGMHGLFSYRVCTHLLKVFSETYAGIPHCRGITDHPHDRQWKQCSRDDAPHMRTCCPEIHR